MASTIGIKIANGEFYPVIEENSTEKKRLILTTVHNKQSSVLIDMYKSNHLTMTDARYIGSLVVENIKPKPQGSPSIELVIFANKNGDLQADALDLDAFPEGQPHSLRVSLKSLDQEQEEPAIPDFELEQQPPMGLYEYETSSKKVWLVIALIGIGILVAGSLAFLFFHFPHKIPANGLLPRPVIVAPPPFPAIPPLNESVVSEVPPLVPPVQDVPERILLPEPVLQTIPAILNPSVLEPAVLPPVVPVQAVSLPRREVSRPPPPVATYKVPATIPRKGVMYKIRWGDTLWDISEAFYRNPRLYNYIARFNKIRNPNRIIPGTIIRIPPRN
ncbi:MAG: Hsp70 family protein [Treponema sp.]|jgi:hypothetical protein|nr:Hsp70 family protein [Treponema sp.]